MSFKDRLIFKTAGYKQEVVNQDPATILLKINNKHADNAIFLDLIIGEIQKALELNGAVKDLDYIADIEND